MGKAALRYCGGCNPRYDRTALVQKFREAFPQMKFEPFDPAEHYCACLVICGCSVRWAGQADLPAGLPRAVVTAPGDYEDAAALLRAADKEI